MSGQIKLDKKIKVKKARRVWKGRRPLYLLAFVFIIAALVVLAAGTYFILIPAQKVSTAVQNIAGTADRMRTDFDKRDLSRLDEYVNEIKTQLDIVNAEVTKYDFLQEVDLTRGYYNNLQVLRRLSDKSQVLITDILPDLKVVLKAIGYQVEPTDVPVEGEVTGDEEQLSGIIAELPRFVELYDQVEIQLTELIEIFNELDTNYIPSIGTGGLKSKVVTAQKVTREFPAISAQLKQTLSILPALLGSQEPADYLVIYQNEKEMRASGGLLSAYGHFQIDKGELGDDISATDMWDLEGYVSWTLGVDVGYRNIYGQNALMNFGCGSTYLRAQDSGIYPDLYWTMDTFKDYYYWANRYNPKKYPAYDHIVILNTFFASDVISLVEPLEVDGKVITSENAAKEIFAETSSQPLDPAIRKEFIGRVATALKEKFNQLSAADFPRVVQTLIRSMQAKNIAFYSTKPEVQAYFDELGLSGRIEKNFAGDYFHLNEAQNCSLKSNFYVYDTVTQNITINDSGDIRKDVRVEWVNEKVYDPNEPFIISNSAFFRYRAWVRLFMPKGAKVINTDGYEKSRYFYWPVEYFDTKMQKQISDNVIYFDHRRLTEADPIRRHDLNVSYSLPAELNYNTAQGYKLLLQKHPGKKDELYVINVNHAGANTSVEFRLDRDKILTYKDGVISVTDFDKRLDDYYDLMEGFKSQ